MRQLKAIVFIGFLAAIGCGDAKTQIPTKQQEMPKVSPASGGIDKGGAATSKES